MGTAWLGSQLHTQLWVTGMALSDRSARGSWRKGAEMIWGQGELSFCRVCCRQGEAFGEEGDPSDGFPPSFSLLRLSLPDQSLMPAPSATLAVAAQTSHILPSITPSQSRRPWDSPGLCVQGSQLGALLSPACILGNPECLSIMTAILLTSRQ